MTSEGVRPEKRKREEISRGRRKHRHEEDLRGDKHEHSPTESCRCIPLKDEDLQDEDDYQAPDKFQRVSEMVFPYRVPRGSSGQTPRGWM